MAESAFIEDTLDSSIKNLSQVSSNIIQEMKNLRLDHEELKGMIHNVAENIGCVGRGADMNMDQILKKSEDILKSEKLAFVKSELIERSVGRMIMKQISGDQRTIINDKVVELIQNLKHESGSNLDKGATENFSCSERGRLASLGLHNEDLNDVFVLRSN